MLSCHRDKTITTTDWHSKQIVPTQQPYRSHPHKRAASFQALQIRSVTPTTPKKPARPAANLRDAAESSSLISSKSWPAIGTHQCCAFNIQAVLNSLLLLLEDSAALLADCESSLVKDSIADCKKKSIAIFNTSFYLKNVRSRRLTDDAAMD